MSRRIPDAKLPISKKWLVDGFCGYARRMVAKQFISFAVQKDDHDLSRLDASTPIVVYANHASWWDPICAMLLRQSIFPTRILYAPIDAEALQHYRILAQLGFYGLQLSSHAGAAAFLTTTKRILETKNASVWITPEGRFADVRDHSASLMPGLAHLASHVSGVAFLPLALEYAFWNESRPQVFAKIGKAITDQQPEYAHLNKADWNSLLTQCLRQNQTELAQSVIARDAEQFEYIIASRPLRLGWYDYFRSWAARWEGKKFDPRHDVTTSRRKQSQRTE
jgi:1-acyl-sn-glycerol-3-phosphate acyltransferase